MKRFFFSLIALPAVAVGCTQSALLETPDFGGTEISFSPYTGRTPVTRAASVENAAGLANASATAAANADPNGFYVYGFLNQINGETKTTSVYLDNKKVYSPSKGANANDWTYEGLVYWPDSQSESTLDFVAYSANGVGKGLSEITEDGFTFTVDNNVANQVDLLATRYYAGNTYDNTTNGTTKGQLSLQFHHLLSRVGFKVQSTTSKKVTITALTFTGKMPTQGTLDFDAANEASSIPALQITSTGTPTYNCLTGTAAAATSGRVPGTEYLMIMPHIAGAEYEGNTDNLKGSDHKVNVTYTIEGSDQVRESTVTLPIGFEFAAGKAYEIVLKISTSSLSFDVQEQDWNTTDNNADINPNDPPQSEEEPEEQPHSNMVVSQASVNGTTATIVLNVLQDYTHNDRYKEVGIAYKEDGSASWQRISAETNVAGRYEFQIENLKYGTSYIYCAYTAHRGSSWGSWTYDYITAGQKYFTTPHQINLPSVTLQDIDESTLTQNSVTVNAIYSGGTVGSTAIGIEEYGFCWVMGLNTPSVTNSKISVSGSPASKFTKTISDLKANTQYSYCAYINTTATTLGNTSVDRTIVYSPIQTFTTKSVVNDDDDTGGDWETGDEDIDFENKQ